MCAQLGKRRMIAFDQAEDDHLEWEKRQFVHQIFLSFPSLEKKQAFPEKMCGIPMFEVFFIGKLDGYKFNDQST